MHKQTRWKVFFFYSYDRRQTIRNEIIYVTILCRQRTIRNRDSRFCIVITDMLVANEYNLVKYKINVVKFINLAVRQ